MRQGKKLPVAGQIGLARSVRRTLYGGLFAMESFRFFKWAGVVGGVILLSLTGCATGQLGGASAGSMGSGGGGVVVNPDNVSAVAAHNMRIRASDTALGVAALADPTGRVAGPMGAQAKKQINEVSHNKMLDDSMKQLTPEQRALMKRRMKGEISEEEFKKELFGKYGLDANGNPIAPKTDN